MADGNAFHEGTSKPMMSLQGGMDVVHTQQPLASEPMNNPRSAGTDNVQQTWNSTSLAPIPAPTGNNDKVEAR